MKNRIISSFDTKVNESTLTIYKVAYLFYFKQKSQKDLADLFKKKQSTISRWLQRARDLGMVKVFMDPPCLGDLADKLKSKLGPDGVRDVFVLPNAESEGDKKNTLNIGAGGAEALINAIRRFDKKTIRITMSCGETLKALVDHLELRIKAETTLREELKQKNWEFYPAALLEDSHFRDISPNYIVTYLMMRLTDVLESKKISIKANIQTLPNEFYSFSKKKRDYFRNNYDVDKLMKEAEQADIFLLGIGTTKDQTYHEIVKSMGSNVKDLPEDTPEIIYKPLLPNEEDQPKNIDKIIKIDLNHLYRNVSSDGNKQVIAIGGGNFKANTVKNTLRQRPFFTTLVTDVMSARKFLGLDP